MQPTFVTMGIVLAVAGTILTGCSTTERTEHYSNTLSVPQQRSRTGPLTMANVDPRIVPGDQIQISVWGFKEFNTTTIVKETGTIVIPLIGEIRAAGLTREKFTDELKARLKEYIKDEPKLTVSIVNLPGLKVSVMGAVTKQDNYPVGGEVSLIEILSSAGGTTTEADLRNVRIFRNGSPNSFIKVDLTNHMVRGDVNTIPPVHPGDTVFVPREENLIRELSGFLRDVLVVFGFFRIVY